MASVYLGIKIKGELDEDCFACCAGGQKLVHLRIKVPAFQTLVLAVFRASRPRPLTDVPEHSVILLFGKRSLV